MENHSEPNDYFIISKEFYLKEDEEIEFFSFYDIVRNTSYILTVKDKKVYMCFKLNSHGSCFYGNFVYEEPRNILIKEIDPVLLFINIIYIATATDVKDKYANLELKDII